MAKEEYNLGFGKRAFADVTEVALDLGASYGSPIGEGHKEGEARRTKDIRVTSHTTGDELTSAVLKASTYEFGTK